MNDTQRTDAAEIKVQCGFKETGTGQVPIAEARKIERDLNECQDAGKHYRASIEKLKRDLAAVNAQLAEKEAECEGLRQDAERWKYCEEHGFPVRNQTHHSPAWLFDASGNHHGQSPAIVIDSARKP